MNNATEPTQIENTPVLSMSINRPSINLIIDNEIVGYSFVEDDGSVKVQIDTDFLDLIDLDAIRNDTLIILRDVIQ